MGNFIAKERLTDFIERMWEANIAVDIRPDDGYLYLWSKETKKHICIKVGFAPYDDLVAEVLNEMKGEQNEQH